MKRILRSIFSVISPFTLIASFVASISAALVLTACPGIGPVTGHAVVDCTKANQDQILSLLGELSPLITTGHPDWSAVEARAVGAGETIGGCVLATLVQDYLGNRAVPHDSADRGAADGALEKFRKEHARGATFHVKLSDGSVRDL